MARSNEEFIKQLAFAYGFAYVGFAKAEKMDDEARKLEAWLNAGHHGEMAYMENHFDLRTDPRKLVPGARSVISLMFNYYPAREQVDDSAPRISRYAYGRDYHKVLRKKLKNMLGEMRLEFGDFIGRGFVDSAPVLERDWALRAGNGWVGKNTMMINPKAGSYFFLAELITDLDLKPDGPMKDYCGTCRKCIDACPTDAIADEGYVLDASRCTSYLTIELRNDIPAEFEGKLDNWVFGCDICQEVCPWNRFSQPHNEPDLGPRQEILHMSRDDWHDLSEETFDNIFSGSAVKRTKYEGLKRNLEFLRRGESDS